MSPEENEGSRPADRGHHEAALGGALYVDIDVVTADEGDAFTIGDERAARPAVEQRPQFRQAPAQRGRESSGPSHSKSQSASRVCARPVATR